MAPKARPDAVEAVAEWCVLLRRLGSGEGEGPLTLVGVIGLVMPGSAVMPPTFSLKEK